MFNWLFKRDNLLLIALALISFIMITIDTGSGGQLLQRGRNLVSGVQGGFGLAVNFLQSPVTRVRDFIALEREKQELEARLEQYRGIEREVISLRNENIRQRGLLAALPRLEHNYLAAGVVARDVQNFFGTIVINRGSVSGIERNMTVVAYNHEEAIFALVGRIIEVNTQTSRILPIFDNNNFVAVRLADGRYEGLFNGLGNAFGYAVMRYLPMDLRDQIRVNDLVVTSGSDINTRIGNINSHFPPEIAIGRVSQIEENPYSASLELSLRSIVDFARLETVFVIMSSRHLAEEED